jgi:hypothetical protein
MAIWVDGESRVSRCTTTAEEMSHRGECSVVASFDEQHSCFLKTWAESQSASYRLTPPQISQTVARPGAKGNIDLLHVSICRDMS